MDRFSNGKLELAAWRTVDLVIEAVFEDHGAESARFY